MRLRKLKLKNFRGYRNSTEIIIDESMTGIVGRNDFGKSTLLEALAIFFETEGMKADKNDMNCFSLREGDGRFEIACEFDDLPDFIMIDDRVQTTLASEHLLNEDGNFEIVKTFKATTSGKPEQTCIRCIHPDEEPLRNLLGMKISELKAVGKEVEKNVADIDVTAQSIEAVAKTVPGVVSALAERLEGGRYIDVDINREKASRYGMTVGDVQLFVSSAIGGAMVGETVEGVARYLTNTVT
ncbi:efflux RND transporter permease subunit [Escherichia coli]|uniref:efflux RND transporter permease subunit n=1 Tax=Escherichia coli TaxID=562 RepID=UPI001BDB7226|nr:efflux RND transporter permease subunit [Escherichia coli]EJE7522498.1 AAA family ATPase [Escherichia coli]HBJ0473470.1 AAA family ATPase [Escherichia coli]HBJ0513328.1 AAA family ATPase [Escherichia coli]HCX4006900.1 AAA family ATPase [Escherichia coli]